MNPERQMLRQMLADLHRKKEQAYGDLACLNDKCRRLRGELRSATSPAQKQHLRMLCEEAETAVKQVLEYIAFLKRQIKSAEFRLGH